MTRRHTIFFFLCSIVSAAAAVCKMNEGRSISQTFRRAWHPLPLMEAFDYFSVNDLPFLLQRPGVSPPSSLCGPFALGKGKLFDIVQHAFPCTVANKESLLLRHESTHVPPATTWRRLIDRLQSHGTNAILLVGDSMTKQHFVDAVCVSEAARYELGLSRGNGAEVVLEIIANDTTQRRPHFLVAMIEANKQSEKAMRSALEEGLQLFKDKFADKLAGPPLVLVRCYNVLCPPFFTIV